MVDVRAVYIANQKSQRPVKLVIYFSVKHICYCNMSGCILELVNRQTEENSLDTTKEKKGGQGGGVHI